MTGMCGRVQPELGAYLDGELTGADRMLVTQHLAQCRTCAEEEGALRDLGEMLRDATAAAEPAADLTGLAGGVVSRVSAERAQSWAGAFERAVDDWRWAMVGAGAVAAAFISAVAVSMMVQFDRRDDSLAALLDKLSAPAGTLFVITSRDGDVHNPTFLQFDSGDGATGRVVWAALPSAFSARERDLVFALDAADTKNGDSASDPATVEVEAILDELKRLHFPEPGLRRESHTKVRMMWLVTNTNVRAGAL